MFIKFRALLQTNASAATLQEVAVTTLPSVQLARLTMQPQFQTIEQLSTTKDFDAGTLASCAKGADSVTPECCTNQGLLTVHGNRGTAGRSP